MFFVKIDILAPGIKLKVLSNAYCDKGIMWRLAPHFKLSLPFLEKTYIGHRSGRTYLHSCLIADVLSHLSRDDYVPFMEGM